MATTSKELPTTKSKTNWRNFTADFFAKASENILDMVITVLSVSILLAYLSITQPVAFFEYGGYIIAIYLCLLFIRIVHDFDDTKQVNEIGDDVTRLGAMMEDIYRMQYHESTMSEEEQAQLEERLQSLL